MLLCIDADLSSALVEPDSFCTLYPSSLKVLVNIARMTNEGMLYLTLTTDSFRISLLRQVTSGREMNEFVRKQAQM